MKNMDALMALKYYNLFLTWINLGMQENEFKWSSKLDHEYDD
jgi:hypothetical protein